MLGIGRGGRILGTALSIGLIGGVVIAGWFGLSAGQTFLEMLTENKRLREAIENVTAESQVGHAKVMERFEADGELWTRLKFVVADRSDPTRRLLEREFELPGDVIHFDALVVRFDTEDVAEGEQRALFLWRRVYSESMSPDQAFMIEEPGEEPARYSAIFDDLPRKDRERFWSEIWRLAEDPDRLESAGIRAIYGSVVYKRMRPGIIYTFRVDATGGFFPDETPDL